MNYLLQDIIYSSIVNLFNNQPDIFMFTSETNMTEWNLGHHLSNEIGKYIFWLDCDLDVIKRNHNNKRPDIIFHKRATNVFNFLVVELKRNRNDRQEDIRKIQEDWMNRPLNYKFGLYINIWGVNEYKAILFNNNREQHDINDSTCNYLELPKVTKSMMIKYRNLMNDIRLRESETDKYETNRLIELFEREILNSFIRYKRGSFL